MWQYETQTAHLSQHEITLGKQASHGPMADRFAACREILSYDHRNHCMLNRCRNCGDRYPCMIKYCEKCFDHPVDPKGWRVDPNRFIADDVVNPVIYKPRVGHGAYRQVQKATKMLEPFYGLPVHEVAPVTLKFCILQGGEDHVAVKNFYHNWTREIMVGFRDLIHPDAKLVYRIEWSWTTAGQVKRDLPFQAPGVANPRDIDPDQVVAFLHGHGFAHFPGFNHSEAGQFFRMVYDGASQVQVATPRPDLVIPSELQESAGLSVWQPQAQQHSSQVNDVNLLDHPDDLDPCWQEIRANQISAYENTNIDHKLDALAEASEHEIDDDITDVERASGLIRWASYACKEHLPSPTSRWVQKGKQTSGRPSASSGTPDLVLTPEQMVIACHADAELKRAFYGKRLTLSFGVSNQSKRAKRIRPSSAVKSTHAKLQNCSSITRLCSNDDDTLRIIRSPFLAFPETAIYRGKGPSATALRLVTKHLTKPGQERKRQTLYYKEDSCPNAANPRFCWVGAGSIFKLSLGCRVLQPP